MKNKIIAVTISVFALMLILAFSSSAAVKKGDMDGDNAVTVTDARLVLRSALGKQSFANAQLVAADYNEDDVIDLKDARLILRHAIGLDQTKTAKQKQFEKVLYEYSHAMLGSSKEYMNYDVTGLLKNYQKWCTIYTIDDVLRPVLQQLGYTEEAINKLAPHTFKQTHWAKLLIRNSVPTAYVSTLSYFASQLDNIIPPSILMAYYEDLEKEGLCKIYNFVDYFDNDVSAEMKYADEDEVAAYDPQVGDIVYITNKTMLVKNKEGNYSNQLIHTAQITQVYEDGTFMCTEGSIVEPSEGDGIARVREREYFWCKEIHTNYDAYGNKIDGVADLEYSSYMFKYNSTVVVLAIIRPDWTYTGE